MIPKILKDVRERAGQTVEDLERLSGLPEGMVTLIENRKASPYMMFILAFTMRTKMSEHVTESEMDILNSVFENQDPPILPKEWKTPPKMLQPKHVHKAAEYLGMDTRSFCVAVRCSVNSFMRWKSGHLKSPPKISIHRRIERLVSEKSGIPKKDLNLADFLEEL